MPDVELTGWFYGSLPPIQESAWDAIPIEQWPRYVVDLVREFGKRKVAIASEAALGFPATWIWSAAEARVVEDHLRSVSAA